MFLEDLILPQEISAVHPAPGQGEIEVGKIEQTDLHTTGYDRKTITVIAERPLKTTGDQLPDETVIAVSSEQEDKGEVEGEGEGVLSLDQPAPGVEIVGRLEIAELIRGILDQGVGVDDPGLDRQEIEEWLQR